jgi:HK97 family phage portal protein
VIAGRIAGEFRQTSNLKEPADWLWDAFVPQRTFAGKSVTPESALSVVPVFAAVRALAEGVGKLPLVVYRDLDRGRERATNSRLWRLLHDEPNDEMAAGDLWETVVAHLNLWGNAYLYKERSRDGRVVGLWPIKPSRVVVGRLSGARVFQVTSPDTIFGVDKGDVEHLSAGTERDILHIRMLSLDGLVGLSPISQARNMIGNAMGAEEYQGRLYANNGRPSGVLSTDRKLSPEAATRLAARWQQAHGGLENAAKTAVLEEGVSWQTIGMPPEDQQFVQSQNFGVAQVARLFRVPPSKINAEKSGSMTYSTVEQENLDWATDSLWPQCDRVERALRRDGDVMAAGLGPVYPEFHLDALLRSDPKTRADIQAVRIRAGNMSPNEARIQEGEPTVDGLDYYVPPYPPRGQVTAQDEIITDPEFPPTDPAESPSDPSGATGDPAQNGHRPSTPILTGGPQS